jgi:hypothetical protein
LKYSDEFLNRDADEIVNLALGVARAERAPSGAHARALTRLATVPVGVSIALAGKKAWAQALGVHGVALKWFAVGLGSAVSGFAVVDHVLQPQPQPQSPPSPAVTVAVPVARVEPPPRQSLPVPSVVSSTTAAPEPRADDVVVRPPTSTPVTADTSSSARPNVAAAPSSRAFDTPSSSRLTREVAVLKRARAALAEGRATQALAVLDDYRAEFSAGLLGAEEAALRVEATFALGDRERALPLADAFLLAQPSSPLSARVRALAEAARAPSKP